MGGRRLISLPLLTTQAEPAAGVGGHLVALRRTAVGPFDLSAAHPVPLPGEPAPPALPLAAAAAAVLPSVVVPMPQAAAVKAGTRIPTDACVPEGPCALLDESGALLAVAQAEQQRWHYRAVFA